MAMTVPRTQGELIDIWQEAAVAVLALADTATDEQWLAQTPCPGWSVGDVVAHIVDVEGLLAAEPRPVHEPDWDTLAHVDGDLSRLTEIGVDYRRGRPKAEVVRELRDLLAKRRDQLDAIPEGAEVTGPFGNPTTMDRLLRIRVLDIWMHEQDIRTALGLDGGWDTRPAQITLGQIVRALPVVWSRNCQAPVGSTVRVSVTGPGLTADFAAVTGADGRGVACDPADAATVHLTLGWPDLVALSAGRVDPSDTDLRTRVFLTGDGPLGETLLQALTITP